MSNEKISCYIALGSNLGQPLIQLQKALSALAKIEKTTLIKTSKFYQTPPLDNSKQPDYINAVALFETYLSAHNLLDHLQEIEKKQGRTRTTKRWGARTIDLDLILYGKMNINTARLIVPHPGLKYRKFVLYPLYDINPNLILPDSTPLQTLLDQISNDGLIPVNYPPAEK